MKFVAFETRAAGLEARKPVSLPLLDGTKVLVDLVPLSFTDDTSVIEQARDFAKAKGSTNPVPGDPLYDRGRHLFTVLRACIDNDVRGKAEPFFESADQIGKFLDPDRVAWLYHHQRDWQQDVSPSPKDIDPLLFLEMCANYAQPGEAEEVPLGALPSTTLRTFVRQLARAYIGQLHAKSLSGSAIRDALTSIQNGSPDVVSTGTPPSTPSSAPSPKDEPK